jgi:DNA-binding PadR family transcriptional regulator
MQDLAECPCTGGTLDRLIQPAILVILSESPLHGYGIAERIGDMPSFSGSKPDVSGIYRFLKTMERKELVVGTWDLSEGGPARKCYQITPAGQQCLQEWVKTLEDYQRRVAALLRATRRTTQG